MMKKTRQSNFELMRIVVMLLIVAHHFVANSGTAELYNMAAHPARMVFMQIWGLFGKAGINAFVLLSGYFMCTSRLTPLRYLKVLLPILLYRLIIYILNIVVGWAQFSWNGLFSSIVCLDLLSNAGKNGCFAASFPVFYLLIPVVSILVRKIRDRELGFIVASALLLLTGLGTFFNNKSLFNEVAWFCVLYLLAAWIRLYAGGWASNLRLCASLLLTSVAITIGYILIRDLFFNGTDAYYLVSDPSRLGSLCIGLFTILTFKSLKVKQNRTINWVASHTYGVLLFHANAFGQKLFWLRGGIFDVALAFELPLPLMMAYSIGSVIAVFIIGVVFDAAVASPIEGFLYYFYEKHESDLLSCTSFARAFVSEMSNRLMQ